MAEETKHDILMKRIQVSIGILVGLTTLIVGVYNIKKTFFPEKSAPGVITASVRTENDRPLSGARVEIFNSQNALVASTGTQSDGQFKKDDLEAGSYSIRVSASGYEPQIHTVQVLPKKTADFQISLRSLTPAQAAAAGSPIRSALEDVGASWLQGLKKGKAEEIKK